MLRNAAFHRTSTRVVSTPWYRTFQYSPWHGIVISPQYIMKGGECVLGSKSLTKRVRVSLDDVEVK